MGLFYSSFYPNSSKKYRFLKDGSGSKSELTSFYICRNQGNWHLCQFIQIIWELYSRRGICSRFQPWLGAIHLLSSWDHPSIHSNWYFLRQNTMELSQGLIWPRTLILRKSYLTDGCLQHNQEVCGAQPGFCAGGGQGVWVVYHILPLIISWQLYCPVDGKVSSAAENLFLVIFLPLERGESLCCP